MTMNVQTAPRISRVQRVAFAAVTVGALLLTACNSTPVVTPTVTSVAVTAAATTLTVGATQQLTASVMGQGTYSSTVTWQSSNTAVLTVDANGLVTAVGAGTATVTATSTADTTKSAQLALTVTTTTPKINAKINFQPQSSAIPAGFTADYGAAYNTTQNYGWVTEASAGTATPVPLDLTLNTRDRMVAGVAPELNTFIHMQYAATGTGNPAHGAWEYSVPNGTYAVTVSVGDANGAVDSTHVINVEGTPAIAGFVPTAANPFDVVTVTVPVTNGMLTIDAKGGTNTKLDYVNIAQQ